MSAENTDLQRAINNLKREEVKTEILKEIAKLYEVTPALAHSRLESIALFLEQFSEEILLDLVTKCATIKADVNRRVQEGLQKVLENMK